MGGCTDCGKKGGCDTRKHGMFAAVDEALARLYPTRRWGERDEATAFGAGVSREEGEQLADEIARRMGTLALFRPGDADEWCDYIYVLCLGRTPAIVEMREGQHQDLSDPSLALDAAREPVAHRDDPGGDAIVEDGGEAGDTGDTGDTGLDERYLRVVLSSVARFAGVQEVAMTLQRRGSDVVITERARSGVFDPVLLPRFQTLVAVLAQSDLRHIDFGEIVEAPPGFEGADYAERFGAEPVIANYLFYPQPPTTVSTVVLAGRDVPLSS